MMTSTFDCYSRNGTGAKLWKSFNSVMEIGVGES